MSIIYALIAGFVGTAVELVEALTVILAVGIVRGWKPALLGMGTAILVLTALVFAVGESLLQVMELGWVQLIVGLCTLLFGIRWLRKAILRYSGLKALHDEKEAFQEELEKQRSAEKPKGFDTMAFTGTFGITFLEGLEAIFIVITVGLSLHSMTYTILGAVIAALVVAVAGIVLRKPLATVPENLMKFIIGIMLTSFGAFWAGEGVGVKWPQADVSILYIIVTLLLLSYVIINSCRKQMAASKAKPFSGTGVSS